MLNNFFENQYFLRKLQRISGESEWWVPSELNFAPPPRMYNLVYVAGNFRKILNKFLVNFHESREKFWTQLAGLLRSCIIPVLKLNTSSADTRAERRFSLKILFCNLGRLYGWEKRARKPYECVTEVRRNNSENCSPHFPSRQKTKWGVRVHYVHVWIMSQNNNNTYCNGTRIAIILITIVWQVSNW